MKKYESSRFSGKMASSLITKDLIFAERLRWHLLLITKDLSSAKRIRGSNYIVYMHPSEVRL